MESNKVEAVFARLCLTSATLPPCTSVRYNNIQRNLVVYCMQLAACVSTVVFSYKNAVPTSAEK
jgi:hypothetical protein